MTMLPFNGDAFTIPSNTGFDNAFENSEYVTIGELVRLTNLRYSTLKYYTEEGMLPFEQAEENLTRRYKREQSVVRIQRIKDLRQAGKSISEIKGILKE